MTTFFYYVDIVTGAVYSDTVMQRDGSNAVLGEVSKRWIPGGLVGNTPNEALVKARVLLNVRREQLEQDLAVTNARLSQLGASKVTAVIDRPYTAQSV